MPEYSGQIDHSDLESFLHFSCLDLRFFFFLPYWTLLCFLLHSQALEHQGEAGTCLYSPPSSVYIIPGKKDQHIGYSVIRKIFTFVNKLPKDFFSKWKSQTSDIWKHELETFKIYLYLPYQLLCYLSLCF